MFLTAYFHVTGALSVLISAFTIIFLFFQWLFDKLSVAELKVTSAPVAGLFILNASCPTLISYEFNIKNCGFLSHTCACPACWSSLDDTQTVNESRRALWELLTRVTRRPRIYLELHYRWAHRTTGQKRSHRSGGAEKSPDAHLSVGEMLPCSHKGGVSVMQKPGFKLSFNYIIVGICCHTAFGKISYYKPLVALVMRKNKWF